MKKIFLSVALLLAVTFPNVSANEEEQKYLKAVGALYAQDMSGGMRMRCTMTAFEKVETGYLFATASHCVGNDDVERERSATSAETFYMTFDEPRSISKVFHPAKLRWSGYQSRGEDLAVFFVASKDDWNTIPLGDEKTLLDGAEYVNIASPLGLGLQTFHGIISKIYLDRPVTQGTINWRGTMVLQQAGVNGGSSGSAIISTEQNAIVGFLVGSIDGGTIIAMPVSRFKAVDKAVKEKKYKYWTEAVETNPDGTPVE